MPRETIRRLSLDVERVLIAGAHLAASDPALAKDRAALDALAAQLGTKAPAIAQLAAAAGKAVGASGKDAARELVSLATMTAQVRCAQAQPAPVAAGTALPERPEIGTPCNAKDLGELYQALVETGKGRQAVIEQAIERGDIADLRVVDALVFAMNDGYIGELVTTKAIPRLGPAIVAPIRAALDLAKGRTVDGRRLRALVAVEGLAARELLLQALDTGNAEMREAALDAIADHLPGTAEFEPRVLAALAPKERAEAVRRAAVRALSGYASDESLAAAVAALDASATHAGAAHALGRSRHPKACDTMLQRLQAVVAEAAEARRAEKARKKSDPPPPTTRRIDPAVMVESLLGALAQQRDPRIAPVAMGLIDDYGVVAVRAALPSADAAQLKLIADLLDGKEEDETFSLAARAAVRLGSDEAWRRLRPAFMAKDREKPLGVARLRAVVGALEGNTEQRWADLCLSMLGEPPAVAMQAMDLVAARRDRRAVKPLLEVLKAAKKDDVKAAAIGCLGTIGDRAALDAILPHAASREWSVASAVREAALALATADDVDRVRALSVADGKGANLTWHLRSLLQTLERRFPGR